MIKHIIIDGDACPVTEDVIKVTENTSISVIIVRSVNHYSLQEFPSHVKTVYVDHGVDSADYKIVQLTTSEDIVITQDYGLASLVLNKARYVLHHLSYEYTSDNIQYLLNQRHQSAQIRRQGGRTKGPKKLLKQDHIKFQVFLKDILSKE